MQDHLHHSVYSSSSLALVHASAGKPATPSTLPETSVQDLSATCSATVMKSGLLATTISGKNLKSEVYPEIDLLTILTGSQWLHHFSDAHSAAGSTICSCGLVNRQSTLQVLACTD